MAVHELHERWQTLMPSTFGIDGTHDLVDDLAGMEEASERFDAIMQGK